MLSNNGKLGNSTACTQIITWSVTATSHVMKCGSDDDDWPRWIKGCIPMFPSPYIPQSLCSQVPMFPSPDVPRPYIPQSYVPQSLSSPTRYALCFLVPVFPSPLLPSPDVPLKCFQSLCSPKIFPSPYVPQSLCSSVPLFPQSILCSQTPSSPELFPVPICSPVPMLHISVSIPYAPQRYSPVHMLTGEHRDWEHVWGT